MFGRKANQSTTRTPEELRRELAEKFADLKKRVETANGAQDLQQSLNELDVIIHSYNSFIDHGRESATYAGLVGIVVSGTKDVLERVARHLGASSFIVDVHPTSHVSFQVSFDAKIVEQQDVIRERLSLDKEGDILQGTFKHYFDMAIDHNRITSTISTILIAVVAAVLALVSVDRQLCGDLDRIAGIAIVVIGLFGFLWSWKQQERYSYWEYLAYKYQDKLTKISDRIKTARPNSDYDRHAQAHRPHRFFGISKLDVLWLWILLNFGVAFLGVAVVWSAQGECAPVGEAGRLPG